MPRRRVDQREIQVSDEKPERDVHQAVVQDHGAGEAVARVLLAEPEQEPGDTEENREGRSEGGVDLLAGVEPSLWSLASAQPQQVVAVEGVELSRGREKAARAESQDAGTCTHPAPASPQLHVLYPLPIPR